MKTKKNQKTLCKDQNGMVLLPESTEGGFTLALSG